MTNTIECWDGYRWVFGGFMDRNLAAMGYLLVMRVGFANFFLLLLIHGVSSARNYLSLIFFLINCALIIGGSICLFYFLY